MIKRYAKKPMYILAIRYSGYNLDDIRAFVGDGNLHVVEDSNQRKIFIVTEKGAVYAFPGDYIVKDANGVVLSYTKKLFDTYFEEATE